MSEGNIAADALRLFIARIERLEEEKKNIGDDIKDVYGEAKSNGYDVKTMRAIVKLRKVPKHDRQEAEALLETYKAALGMSDFFLGESGASSDAAPEEATKPEKPKRRNKAADKPLSPALSPEGEREIAAVH